MSFEIRPWWRERAACLPFRTGVCLHSHTLHSHEYLSFIPQYLKKLPLLDWVVRREARWHGLDGIPATEFSRAWWTPPLSPRQAWDVEKSPIENTLQKAALVSITDHDNIDAAAELRAAGGETQDAPVSVEWTAPYGGSEFHIGVHNMPPLEAPALVRAMKRYTENRSEELFADLLETLNGFPEALVVLNHPLWDAEDAGPEAHRFALGRLLGRYGRSIHALEFNGDRPWRENRETMELAGKLALPVVGGGDRHGCHASPIVNLTNASDFGGYAEEVRAGHSVVTLMPRLRESFKMRIFEAAFDILRDHPGHSRGWVRWSDRVFYTRKCGAVASLSELWGRKQPGAIRSFVNLMGVLRKQTVRPALRWALAERESML